MARIVLAPALARWLPTAGGKPSTEVVLDVPGDRLDAVLDGVFAAFPNLRGYVLDEHGAVRHHIAVFVDGIAIADKQHPAQPLEKASEVYLMQALSGG